MLTVIGLITAALLQVVAAIGALWLLRVSRARAAWIMIFIAFMFMAFRRVMEIMAITHGEIDANLRIISNWTGIIVSAIMAVAVIMIGRILFRLKRAEATRLALE
jgi:hypothetical protein